MASSGDKWGEKPGKWKPTQSDKTSDVGGSRSIASKVEAAQRADLSRTGSGAGRKMGSSKSGKC